MVLMTQWPIPVVTRLPVWRATHNPRSCTSAPYLAQPQHLRIPVLLMASEVIDPAIKRQFDEIRKKKVPEVGQQEKGSHQLKGCTRDWG